MKTVIFLLLIIFFAKQNPAQSIDSNYKPADSLNYRIGELELKKIGSNYYNHSEPDKINFEVILWGGVRNPGKYLIPKGTTLVDILTLSGGPATKENIYRFIKIFRNDNSSGSKERKKIININYYDFYSKEIQNSKEFNNPILQPGDLIVLPIEPELSAWDVTKEVLYIVTPLVSIATLILQIISLSR